MKNILTYIVLFLTFNVYGQNNSKIVNLDSINFYFGEKLNAERIKLGKPTVSYNQKLSVVELDWIDNYFQYIIKQEDEIVECMKNRTQPKYVLPTMHGTGENNFSHRYDKYFKEFTRCIGENMAIEYSKDTLSYKDISTKLFNQWVKSNEHYKNMTNNDDKLDFGKYCLVIRYIKYGEYYIYMGGLFLRS